MKIIADNKIPFLKGVLDSCADVEYLSPSAITKDAVKDADALIIRTRTKCGESLLDGSKVKFIATATIGFDHIDTEYCKSRGIEWVNAPGCNSSSVRQYLLAALLSIAGKYNLKLSDMTIGIVGVGNVGSKIESAARLLGMKVLLNDPPRARAEGELKFASMDEIFSSADIVTLHVPLNKTGEDKTLHYADEKFFGKFKKPVIFINSSRGEVTNSGALKKAISGGRVISAVIDVWENEPGIDLELLRMADIATPHIAGYSSDGKANGTSVCVNAVNKYFNLGLPIGWYPPDIPFPVNSNLIEIDCAGLTIQQICSIAVLHTYNIFEDDDALKKNPENFEKLRDYYRVRREFQAYSIKIKNSNPEINNCLTALGFNIVS